MHSQGANNSQRKQGAALLSIVSNSTLVVGKLVIGMLCGSVAVISEAVHSASDLMASIIAYLAVRMSDSPPDEDHPYGHGKIESISSLAEALLIFGAALYIVYEAVHKLLKPPQASPPLYLAMGVMAVSVLVNFFISRHLRRVGKETDSLALLADAEHLKVDVMTTAGVLIGLAQKSIRALRVRIANRMDDREVVKRAETLGRVFRYLAAVVISLMSFP